MQPASPGCARSDALRLPRSKTWPRARPAYGHVVYAFTEDGRVVVADLQDLGAYRGDTAITETADGCTRADAGRQDGRGQ